MKSTAIKFESKVKESEKAVLLTVKVNWNWGESKERDLWFPKSVIEKMTEDMVVVADWFVSKTKKSYTFKGYEMNFTNSWEY